MILAHFTGGDASSAALTLGIAALVLAWKHYSSGRRPRAARLALAGVVAIAIGVATGVVHAKP